MWHWLQRYTSIALSHPGHVRERNEDAILADDKNGLWLVADGMGGHAGGDVASGLACSSVSELVSQGCSLVDAIEQTHQRILQKGRDDSSLAGMGTTLVAAQQQGKNCILAWVGDSRIYLWRAGVLSQLSIDHSFVQDLIFRGVLTKEEAQTHPQKNLVNQALGQANLKRLKIDSQVVKLKSGDQLLLCSDGLHDMLTDEQLAQCFIETTTLIQRQERLLQAVLTTDARDNVSFVLVAVDRAPLFECFSFWLK